MKGRGFEYVRNKFPNVSDAKIKDGVFIGPPDQGTELLRKSQSGEISGCCARHVEFVQSYGLQYESENPLSGNKLEFFPRKSRRSQ